MLRAIKKVKGLDAMKEIPKIYMQITTIAVLVVAVFLSLPGLAAAEPKQCATFGRWDVFVEMSMIDNRPTKMFCVSQSKNNIRSKTDMKWALLFFEIGVLENRGLELFASFPEPLPGKSSVRTKIDNKKVISGDWVAKGSLVRYLNYKKIVPYIQEMKESGSLIMEVKLGGSIIYEASFDLNGFAEASEYMGMRLAPYMTGKP